MYFACFFVSLSWLYKSTDMLNNELQIVNKDSYAKIQMPDVDIEKQIEFVKIA